MIEAASKGHGVSTARCVCDKCNREEIIPCTFERQPNGTFSLNEGKAQKKITQMGWASVKKHLYCPTCEAKRKAEMPHVEKPEPPKEPSRAQKREIIAALDEYYDLEAERYKGGETDETIADLIDVRPGFVARIREELYGPDGANEDIAELERKLSGIFSVASETLKDMKAAMEAAEKLSREVATMQAELQKIKQAVGPRKLAVAGVR